MDIDGHLLGGIAQFCRVMRGDIPDLLGLGLREVRMVGVDIDGLNEGRVVWMGETAVAMEVLGQISMGTRIGAGESFPGRFHRFRRRQCLRLGLILRGYRAAVVIRRSRTAPQ